MTGTVCVIITARNAAGTIAEAVRSALIQPEVAEVVVVDDASTDDTGGVATRAAAGDSRLRVLRHATNLGPAAGRNRAIAASQAPFLAILDADDYLLPDRFGTLTGTAGWDLVADNIAFVPDGLGPLRRADLPMVSGRMRPLGLADFVAGNLRRGAGAQRGELGFLKPVLSRAFLDRHGLRYDETLWLGEDFDLYVRMLLRGARFRVSNRCGYVARVRAGSLSGRHRTGDLGALMMACEGHLTAPDLPVAARVAMRQHLAELRSRFLLRQFLDEKASHGRRAALAYALWPLANFLPIATGVARDKLRALRPQPEALPPLRLLLPTEG